MANPSRRCAIYTRKSSEEGLEQDYNSLHAQREACEAFISSQAGEGWRLVKTAYDDGGFSGAGMERPGLRQLLANIREGLVDTVVVYKVDRLTRSLPDFARMVELFDAKGASFVAVTQQFNTTTSMGRLTPNVLLSFAQFEREVIGERIRDKVAASKRKGMWMGGSLPMGYDVRERKLVVNRDERSFGVFQEKPFEVVWRFAKEVAEEAKEFLFHPTQQLQPQKDGSLIVRFKADGTLEMSWHLYTWGDAVKVLEPKDFWSSVKNTE